MSQDSKIVPMVLNGYSVIQRRNCDCEFRGLKEINFSSIGQCALFMSVYNIG